MSPTLGDRFTIDTSGQSVRHAMSSRLRAIAFFLPQFHPIPENDAWWGKGFTEWTNVTKARPQFPGHYQPHVPADLGFYDLRLADTREAQADLARQYGIHGFCYYHYWFTGRSILQRPFEEVLISGRPDFPFCLCWANENWTRVWDGSEREILLEQRYSEADDVAHIKALLPAFRDPRYIRVHDKPIFLVYRTGLLPDPARTASVWRQVARTEGVGELYLVRVESHGAIDVDPRTIGFDAAVQFSPDLGKIGKYRFRSPLHVALARAGLLSRGFIENNVGDYNVAKAFALNRPEPEFVHFKCVNPSWDNTARRRPAWILLDSTPSAYEHWLKEAVRRTIVHRRGDEQLVFINAWNEWAEGNHLEPDIKWGHAYLEATRRALATASAFVPSTDGDARAIGPVVDPVEHSFIKQRYWNARASVQQFITKSMQELAIFKYLGRRSR